MGAMTTLTTTHERSVARKRARGDAKTPSRDGRSSRIVERGERARVTRTVRRGGTCTLRSRRPAGARHIALAEDRFVNCTIDTRG